MNGSAPYVSRTTSHCEVLTNREIPVVASSGFATRHSSERMSKATTSTATPRTPREAPQARSGRLWRLRGGAASRRGWAPPPRSLAPSKGGLSPHPHLPPAVLHLFHPRLGRRGRIGWGGHLFALC